MSEQILRSVSLCRNGAVQPEGYGTTLVFGCAGNRGVYRVGVVQEDEWTGLTVQAHWHVPGGKDPPASLVENGEVAVPALVTAVPGEGCITFEGTDGAGVTVVSADVEYRVAGNTGTGEGTMPEPETPAWEAFVKLVLDDKVENVIQLATTSAKKTAADAAKAEVAAGKAEENAAKAQAAQREVSTEHGTAMTEIATAKKDALDKIETARTTAVEQAQAAAEEATGAANKAGEAARTAQAAKNEAEQALGSIRTDGPAAVKAIADAKSGAVQAVTKEKTAALEEVETATESAQQAAQAAQEAQRNAALKASSAETNARLAQTAKENAQGSASNARASENASKEYLKKIQTIAQGAQGWYATPTALQNAVPSGQNGWWAIVGSTDTIWVWDGDSGTGGAWVESGGTVDLSGFYTKDEVDTKLNGKANSSHTHDDRYYTKDDADSKLNGKANSSHSHDDRYYTESEVDNKLTGKANSSHTHDDRYYTESEVDSKLAGKANTSHTHNYAGSSSAGGTATSVNGFKIVAQTSDPGAGSSLPTNTILLVYK